MFGRNTCRSCAVCKDRHRRRWVAALAPRGACACLRRRSQAQAAWIQASRSLGHSPLLTTRITLPCREALCRVHRTACGSEARGVASSSVGCRHRRRAWVCLVVVVLLLLTLISALISSMPQRGRPHGTPQPAGFGRATAATNRQRALKRKIDEQHAEQMQVWQRVEPSRSDELPFLARPAPVAGRRGERRDKAILTEAIIAAAFAPDPGKATGLGDRTCVRCEFLSACCLLHAQGCMIRDLLQAGHPWLVFKRSADETHVNTRGADGSIAPTKILNSRGFVRWGPGNACARVLWPAVELLGTDALALAEGFDRVLAQASIPRLQEAAGHSFVALVTTATQIELYWQGTSYKYVSKHDMPPAKLSIILNCRSSMT